MAPEKLINASQWLCIQCDEKSIYSPNASIIDRIKKKQAFWPFWLDNNTAFACIIYDKTQQEVIAVRDHFGLEPCYYSHLNGQFVFGSTIPSVLNHITPLPAMNSAELNQLFVNKWFASEIYSDETYYHSVYRLEPGCELRIDLSDNRKPAHKTKFWDLKQHDQTIHYADARDYVAHFSELLSEALQIQLGSDQNIAAEFSGGLDSSAVVAAARCNNIDPTLYMHVATPGSSIVDDMEAAQTLIRQLDVKKVHYIDAKTYDLLASMDEYAHYFAGAAPYTGFVLAHNIHRAIAAQGHQVVLSGIGGDECVSSHAPLRTCIRQMIREQGMRAAWHELYQNYYVKGRAIPSAVKRGLQWLKLAYLKPECTLRDHEYNLLQGPGSYHLRMRVEYSSVLAKAMGYRYVFPLLYPPLVAFCYQLPLEQKRLNGVNRCLIRNYLAQFFPAELYGKQTKSGSVTPATIEKTQALYEAGIYNAVFQHLPFQMERNRIQLHSKIIKKYKFMSDIPAYMFQKYWDTQFQTPGSVPAICS